MIVDVSTVLNCSAAKAWNEVQKSSLPRHVIRPLARLVPVGAPLPERWSEGHTIQCKLFVFGVIPIGVRTLHFEKIAQKTYDITNRDEGGRLPFVGWAWANWFYRHRQRRWRALAKTL